MALEKILQHQRKMIISLPEIQGMLLPSDRDFLSALLKSPYHPSVIAELKPKSPSVGQLASDNYDPSQQAKKYQQGGAAALSVLTEQEFFGGKLTDLTMARSSTNLPVLCKDFILSNKQVKLARQSGADACLLIVAALNSNELSELKASIESYNMLAVIEVHTEAELQMALAVKPKVLLINNRNLWDLSMHSETTAKLLPKIPSEIPVISASGFDDIVQIKALPLRICAVLIGTQLMREANPQHFLEALRR